MNTDMHGKKIAGIWLAGSEGPCSERVTDLVLSATYHGDRDELWAVKVDDKGSEVRRYNLKYVTCIEWA